MKPWQQIGETETVYDGWRKVFRKRFLTNSSGEFVAEINDSADAKSASAIILTADNKVVIARQFRVGPGRVMEELPGGRVDPGETPEEAVVREVREETGYKVGRISKIGEIYKGAYSATKHFFYLAEDCYLADSVLNLDEGEEIEVDLISISKLFDNAMNGRMTGVQALFFAHDKLKELEGE